MTAARPNARRGQFQGMESVEIIGPFDTCSAELETFIKQILEEGQTAIVIDMSRTTYVTSPAIVAIIKTINWFHAVNGSVFIHGATSDIRDFMTLSRIDTFVKFI
jgi:anti-anti-sigma regulatory factor